jgi:hypothetical protein
MAMPIKPATKLEEQDLMKALMDPNDERDLLAFREKFDDKTARKTQGIRQETPNKKEKIPKKSEMIDLILAYSKASRTKLFPELEREKELDPNYNSILLKRAELRASQYISELRTHNARVVTENTTDYEKGMKQYGHLINPKKVTTRKRSPTL